MTQLIFFVALAVGVSFLCSILEAALLSTTSTFIAAEEKKGKKYATILKRLKSDPENSLAVILTLNTVANTLGATGAGAQALIVLGSELIAVFTVAFTLTILIVSEIIPKSLGAAFWRRLAPYVAYVLNFLVVVMRPVGWLSYWISRLIGSDKADRISREELQAIGDVGLQEGLLDEAESHIFTSFLKFGRLKVEAIMTPRSVMFCLPESTTLKEAIANKSVSIFSRVPVYGVNEDDMTGYVLKSAVLKAIVDGKGSSQLADYKREILLVDEDTKVKRLFRTLYDRHEHMSVIVNEWGVVLGLATMEDILETMLGVEIQDELDTVEDMQALARNQWEKRARRMGLLE